jgi:hypothetical protein
MRNVTLERLIQPPKALWLYLCGRPMWVRVVLAPLLWLALNVVLAGCFALIYALYPSDQASVLLFAGFFLSTYGLGYLVGNWWAVAAPLLLMIGVTVDLFVEVSNDPDFGLFVVGIVLLAALLFFAIKVGIDGRQRRLRADGAPK